MACDVGHGLVIALAGTLALAQAVLGWALVEDHGGPVSIEDSTWGGLKALYR